MGCIGLSNEEGVMGWIHVIWSDRRGSRERRQGTRIGGPRRSNDPEEAVYVQYPASIRLGAIQSIRYHLTFHPYSLPSFILPNLKHDLHSHEQCATGNTQKSQSPPAPYYPSHELLQPIQSHCKPH